MIQTYSGYEERVRDALRRRAEQAGLADEFGEILIPIKPALSFDSPRQKKPRLPGFLFVEMALSERVWQLVKETPKVTGLIGNQTPQEVPLSSVERLRPPRIV